MNKKEWWENQTNVYNVITATNEECYARLLFFPSFHQNGLPAQ